MEEDFGPRTDHWDAEVTDNPLAEGFNDYGRDAGELSPCGRPLTVRLSVCLAGWLAGCVSVCQSASLSV